jgi:hypothetical protein
MQGSGGMADPKYDEFDDLTDEELEADEDPDS